MPGVESIIAYQRWHTSTKSLLRHGQSCSTSRNISESISTGMRWAFPGGSIGSIAPKELKGVDGLRMRGLDWFPRDELMKASARGEESEGIHSGYSFKVIWYSHYVAQQVVRRFCHPQSSGFLASQQRLVWTRYILTRQAPVR
jgi:hypothetical protein